MHTFIVPAPYSPRAIRSKPNASNARSCTGEVLSRHSGGLLPRGFGRSRRTSSGVSHASDGTRRILGGRRSSRRTAHAYNPCVGRTRPSARTGRRHGVRAQGEHGLRAPHGRRGRQARSCVDRADLPRTRSARRRARRATGRPHAAHESSRGKTRRAPPAHRALRRAQPRRQTCLTARACLPRRRAARTRRALVSPSRCRPRRTDASRRSSGTAR